MKKLLIWALIVFGLIGATWGMAQLASSPGDQTTTFDTEISDSDWVKGDPNASVILIEYSDLQCPACAAYAPMVNQLIEEFGNRIAFVYRHFPLTQHKNAELAARSAEAAGKQGKFWEMVDLIFTNQSTWEAQSNAQETFAGYADSLGLDVNRFKNDLDSKEIKDKIENDYFSGAAIVNYTPTFFLNGEKIQNPRDYEEFRSLILQKLEQNP